MSDLVKPTFSLVYGTDPEDLLQDLEVVDEKFDVLLRALRDSTPRPRDYPEDLYLIAVEQHERRLSRLVDIRKEIGVLLNHASEFDRRRAR